jgi:hypothetical protein
MKKSMAMCKPALNNGSKGLKISISSQHLVKVSHIKLKKKSNAMSQQTYIPANLISQLPHRLIFLATSTQRKVFAV